MSAITLLKDLMPESIKKVALKHYYFGKIKAAVENDLFDREIEFKYFRKLIKSGDNVVDIGANFGYYTTFFSKQVCDKGCVYSMEPIPLTFDILSNNIKKMNLNNVKAFNLAISDSTGKGIMEIPKYHSGGNNFYQARIVKKSRENSSLKRYSVTTRTLDSIFFEKDTPISFLKIDVEGHELKVINGAISMIGEFKPALYIEVPTNPDKPGSSAAILFEKLFHLGYLPYICDGREIRRRAVGDFYNDYFFLTRTQYQEIKNLE